MRNYFKWISPITFFIAIPNVLHAMPHVDGNTVTWPTDNWYQVQDSTSYETVCEGNSSDTSSANGGPCVIGSGLYIVINHSTGERFENISATAPLQEQLTSEITVDGDVISLPDNGWYQVQNAENFISVCEGKRSCQVEPGTYIVINHRSGERFENIVVPWPT